MSAGESVLNAKLKLKYMSDDNNTSKNQPIDLSALANLEFSTAWSPSSNTSKFEEPRSFKKRSDGDFKRREGRRDSGEFKKFGNSDGEKKFEKRRERRDDFKKSDSKNFKDPKFKREQKAPFVPTMEVLFYPEDAPFAKLADVMKRLKRTYQLFDIAELILEKSERFIVLAKNLPSDEGEVKPLYCAQPLNLPFETEQEAKKFALEQAVSEMFEKIQVEAEAPKGNFQFVNKCSISGDLLGAPNWHKYGEHIREYHAEKFPNMPYEKFLASIETVRDEESVAKWVDQMKTRDAFKLKEGETVFESYDAACAYVLEQKGAELVKAYEQVRMHGADIAKLPFSSRIRRNVEAIWNKQKHFPIVTANNLRGRLRRAGFTIYKRGSKGFAFVCAVKRKFLLEGDSLSDTPQKIFDYVAENSGVKASVMPYKYLNLKAPKGLSKAAPLAEEHKKQAEGEEVSAPINVEVAEELSAEVAAQLKEVSNELLWLISEGYVVEYADGSLQANPRMPKPKGKAVNTAASDAESIELGEADEPLIQSKSNPEQDKQQQEENEAEASAIIEEKSEATDISGVDDKA